MRAIIQTAPGVIELNFLWLPTCIGCNNKLMTEMQRELALEIEGQPLTEESLDAINDKVLDFLAEKIPVDGLYHYLDGLKFLEEPNDEGREATPQAGPEVS